MLKVLMNFPIASYVLRDTIAMWLVWHHLSLNARRTISVPKGPLLKTNHLVQQVIIALLDHHRNYFVQAAPLLPLDCKALALLVQLGTTVRKALQPRLIALRVLTVPPHQHFQRYVPRVH